LNNLKPVLQTKFGKPEGNCFAACIASILECDLADLPDFADKPADENWLAWFNALLAPKGFGIFHSEASAEKPLNVYIPLGTHFIVAGPGKRGIQHCVIMKSNGGEQGFGDDFVHDPYPGGAGLASVSSICLVVKL
jgi:hypothetical protein